MRLDQWRSKGVGGSEGRSAQGARHSSYATELGFIKIKLPLASPFSFPPTALPPSQFQ